MHYSRLAPSLVILMATLAPVSAAMAGGSIKDTVAEPVRTAWHGLYVGVQASYNSVDADGGFDNAGTPPHADFATFDLDGAGLGGQVGYNHRLGSFMLGVEADYSGLDIGDDVIDGEDDRQSLDISGFGSIRGRLGYVHNNSLLIYGTVGIGQLRGELTVENGDDRLQFKETAVVYGGGVEWMLGKNVSVRAEYLRFDVDTAFDLRDLDDGDTGDRLGLTAVDTVRFGLNFHLN
jgi:outer membrane immunogenic protein